MPNESAHAELKPPGAWLMMLEGRAPWEVVALLAASPWLGRPSKAQPGDGHPVLVFPGLAVNDLTTWPIRKFLRARGYTPYPWGLGVNLGPRNGVLQACIDLARSISEHHRRPLSLLGWSLGGIYAREVAKALPDQTRCVITLGTPFTGHPRATNAWRLFQWVSRQSVYDPALMARIREAPPVPTTSIYSRSDGVVAWQCSVNPDGPLAENIGIHASHFGMGLNPLALYAVADRLAQDPAHWRRFECSGARRWFFETALAAQAAG